MQNLTLNEALHRLGFTTKPGGIKGTKDILRGGVVVLRNKRAGEVWNWLRNQKKKESADQ